MSRVILLNDIRYNTWWDTHVRAPRGLAIPPGEPVEPLCPGRVAGNTVFAWMSADFWRGFRLDSDLWRAARSDCARAITKLTPLSRMS